MGSHSPGQKGPLLTNEEDRHIDFTFADIKRESDKTASFFQSLGIKRGDMVMLILKRRYEFWFSIIALHKIGAVCIPATHLLTEKDIIYRCNAADIKMIVAVGEERCHRTRRPLGGRLTLAEIPGVDRPHRSRRLARLPRRHRGSSAV